MVYLFLGLGVFWALLGLTQLAQSWGQTPEMRAALGSLLMALFNVAVAWFLHWRTQRRAGWRR